MTAQLFMDVCSCRRIRAGGLRRFPLIINIYGGPAAQMVRKDVPQRL